MKLKIRDRLNIANKVLTRQLYIVIRVMPEFDNKLWVGVTLRRAQKEWVVSFRDLFHIIKCIGECEDIKYPPRDGYRGKNMVLDFLSDCLVTNLTYEELANKYQIPERGQQ